MKSLIKFNLFAVLVSANAPNLFREFFNSIPGINLFMNNDIRNRMTDAEAIEFEKMKFMNQMNAMVAVRQPQQVIVQQAAPNIAITNNVSSSSSSNSQSQAGSGSDGGYNPAPVPLEETYDKGGLCYIGAISAIPPGGRMCDFS